MCVRARVCVCVCVCVCVRTLLRLFLDVVCIRACVFPQRLCQRLRVPAPLRDHSRHGCLFVRLLVPVSTRVHISEIHPRVCAHECARASVYVSAGKCFVAPRFVGGCLLVLLFECAVFAVPANSLIRSGLRRWGLPLLGALLPPSHTRNPLLRHRLVEVATASPLAGQQKKRAIGFHRQHRQIHNDQKV